MFGGVVWVYGGKRNLSMCAHILSFLSSRVRALFLVHCLFCSLFPNLPVFVFLFFFSLGGGGQEL